MGGNRLRIERHHRFELRPKRFRFAAWNQPGIQIPSATRIDLLERIARRVPLVKFNR
jgi:hypothetical protein